MTLLSSSLLPYFEIWWLMCTHQTFSRYWNRLPVKRTFDSKTARILEYCSKLANPIYFFYRIKDMNNKTKIIQNGKKYTHQLFIAAIVLSLSLCFMSYVVTNDAFSLTKQREPEDRSSSSYRCEQAGLQWVHSSIACAGL